MEKKKRVKSIISCKKMKHYFFKFGRQNYLFQKYADENNLKIGAVVPLSIYFGKWKVADYMRKKPKYENYIKKKNHLTKTQIDTFVNIGSKDIGITRFWIFFSDKIFVLKPIGKIGDGPKEYKDKSGSNPKTINSKVIKIFPKSNLPEFFATINSNQKYNRKTIEQFKDKENLFSNHLLKCGINRKFKVNKKDALCYLSPIQFETLIFLIFHHLDVFCTTYRGGTLKGTDLKIHIKPQNKIKGFKISGSFNIQVKMYDFVSKRKINFTDNTYLVHLGNNDYGQKTLGVDWINDYIERLPKVKKWISKSLLNISIK